MSALQLNAFESTQAKNAGILKAVTKANKDSPEWCNRAFDLLKQFLDDHVGEFQGEDLRAYAVVVDFDLPENARAWGGVISKAAHQKLIRKIGVREVKNVKAHCALASVWIKV